MKKINSKIKGKIGELEFSKFLITEGFNARRGQQFSGSPDSPDVVCESLPFHWEIKRVEKLNIYDAVEQAKTDCPVTKHPIVAHRKNRGEWLVTMPANHFFWLIKSYENQKEKIK